MARFRCGVWGGEGEGEMSEMTMGEKWLHEVRIIHYIVVLPVAIFTRGGGGGGGMEHSLTAPLKGDGWRLLKQR